MVGGSAQNAGAQNKKVIPSKLAVNRIILLVYHWNPAPVAINKLIQLRTDDAR
jgi:hypothetical protein